MVHPQDWPAVIVIMPAWCTGWASAACPVSAPNIHSHLDCGPVVAVAQPSPGNQLHAMLSMLQVVEHTTNYAKTAGLL